MTTSHKAKWMKARIKIQDNYCLWILVDTYDANQWATQCGAEWIFDEGSPRENGYKFCPMCGKHIKLQDL